MTNSLLRDLAQRLYEHVPSSRAALHVLNNAMHPPTFSGWGMTTQHALPWDDAHDWGHFRQALQHVESEFEHGLRRDTGITAGTVGILGWRHWIVSCTVRYACYKTQGHVSLVECGVGDGLTAYFAANEAEHQRVAYSLDCYDTWEEVRVDDQERNYAALSLPRTQRNLSRFGDRVRYHQGLVPETLRAAAPELVNYLSIDLNAAEPTIAALDHFLPRMPARGAILFDDYGFVGYEATRRAVDDFLAEKPGVLQKLPTGQAVFYT
ncbi:MAG: class I SAM-dependent methyltransferase [Deltaproteobacteria bacterium]|nr:class I SAM-dependent methyltransferase [Deltaproteobacteria bacterium]